MFTLRIDNDIELRLIDRALAPKMFEIIQSEKAYLSEWLAWPELTKNLTDYLGYVKVVSQDYANGKGMACNILYQGNPVGCISFNYINELLKKAEIGYWLSEKYQGKGIVTKCSKKLINIAFNELNLDKIEIPVAEKNLPSRAVCERLGMSIEGTISNAENLNGKIVNHVFYALARP